MEQEKHLQVHSTRKTRIHLQLEVEEMESEEGEGNEAEGAEEVETEEDVKILEAGEEGILEREKRI